MTYKEKMKLELPFGWNSVAWYHPMIALLIFFLFTKIIKLCSLQFNHFVAVLQSAMTYIASTAPAWAFIYKRESQAPPQTFWVRICYQDPWIYLTLNPEMCWFIVLAFWKHSRGIPMLFPWAYIFYMVIEPLCNLQDTFIYFISFNIAQRVNVFIHITES